MKKPENSVQKLFLLNIIIVVGILLSIQAGLNAMQVKAGMEEQVMETLKARAEEIAGQMNQRLLQVGQKTFGLALAVTSLPEYDPHVMYQMADGYIRSDALIIGSGFWFEPDAYRQGMQYFGPYRHRVGNEDLELTMIYSNAEYNYAAMDWYQNAMSNPDKVAWTGPYLDDVTGITMLTTAATIQKDRKAVGCVTVDIGLEELENYIRRIRIGKNGYAILISQDGYYLASQVKEKNMRIKLTEDSDPAMTELGKKIIASKQTSLFEAYVSGNDCYIMVSPLCIENMKLVLVAPKSDYTEGIWHALLLSVVMMLLVMMLLCITIHKIFKRRIGHPIRQLAAAADRIANDEPAELCVSSNDEMGHLSHSLQEMAKHLHSRNEMLENQYRMLSIKNRQLEVALQNVENMRISRDNYKIESEIDMLTGLLNKTTVERLSNECLASLLPEKLAALYILDLDHFKEANDTHGHQHGDDILRNFAAELRKGFRPGDIIGRFGGDEFIVLISGLPDTDIIERKAQFILSAARNLRVDGENAGISVSIGAAIAPRQGTTYEELFQAADKALYRTKENGRDGCTIGDNEPVH